MAKDEFDFYSKTSIKSYNLNESMRYQLQMLDQLDVFTRKHCENVANITCRLCEYLHCSKDFIVYCTTCAYLHDLGKLFIPASVLQFPGRLSEEQIKIMRTHTTLGYEMCMKDPKLRKYAAGTIYHHEGLDGSGYPKGLKKKDIPIEGQIIRVADEYDAIVSKRQYKSHIDISETLKILVGDALPLIGHKYGKINKKVLKALFKVVIDDVEFEIYQVEKYVESLKEDISRMQEVVGLKKHMDKTKSQKKKDYYLEGIKLLTKKGETAENCEEAIINYQDALKSKREALKKLHSEIGKIKALRFTLLFRRHQFPKKKS